MIKEERTERFYQNTKRKMKIALLMGGEFRNFEKCIVSWRKNLLDNFEYDLFLSTWSETNSLSDKFPDITRSTVTEERVVNALGKQAKFLNIEKEILFELRPNKQIYHWTRLITQLVNYKDEYDFAILTRPDVSFNERSDYPLTTMPEFVNTCNKQHLYGASTIAIADVSIYHRLTIYDIYFMSGPKTLIESFISLPMINDEVENRKLGQGHSMHNWLASHFVNKNIYVHQYGFGNILDSSSFRNMYGT